MSEWIEWEGGKRPVHKNTMVDIKCSGDSVNMGAKAGYLSWSHLGEYDDIVAYRLSEMQPVSALDVQIEGNHYKQFKIQPVEFIHANGLSFCQGSVIKYVTRYKSKGGVSDLEKAKHFIDLLIELEKREG